MSTELVVTSLLSLISLLVTLSLFFLRRLVGSLDAVADKLQEHDVDVAVAKAVQKMTEDRLASLEKLRNGKVH